MGHLRLTALAVFACATGPSLAAGLVVSGSTSGGVSRAVVTAIKPGTSVSLVGGLSISDAVEVRTPTGRAVGASLISAIPPNTAARIAARVLPVVGAAALAYELYDELRVRPSETGDGLAFDPGVSPSPIPDCMGGNFGFFTGLGGAPNQPSRSVSFCTPSEAQAAYVAHIRGAGRIVVSQSSSRHPAGFIQVNVTFRNPGEPVTSVYSSSISLSTATTVNGCALGPGGTRPPIQWDGKCPTGTWLQPMTEEEAANRVFAPGRAPISDAQWKEILDDAYGRMPTPVSVSGMPLQSRFQEPAPVVDGARTTTTTSAGTETRQQQLFGIPYSPSPASAGNEARMGWGERETVTRTDPSGSPLPGTDVRETRPAEPAPGEEQQSEQCPEGSTQSGCAKLEDVPDQAVAWQSQAVSFASESLGLASACPSPQSFEIRGWAMALDYTPACTVAPFVRAGVLSLTALACLFFVLRETRS